MKGVLAERVFQQAHINATVLSCIVIRRGLRYQTQDAFARKAADVAGTHVQSHFESKGFSEHLPSSTHDFRCLQATPHYCKQNLECVQAHAPKENRAWRHLLPQVALQHWNQCRMLLQQLLQLRRVSEALRSASNGGSERSFQGSHVKPPLGRSERSFKEAVLNPHQALTSNIALFRFIRKFVRASVDASLRSFSQTVFHEMAQGKAGTGTARTAGSDTAAPN